MKLEDAGLTLIISGFLILVMWLSMMPLYKYPTSSDIYYGYLMAIITLWLVLSCVMIASGILLQFYKRSRE